MTLLSCKPTCCCTEPTAEYWPFLLVFLAGPHAVSQFLPSLLHMRLGHPSPGRATCGLGVLVFKAVYTLKERGRIRARQDLPFLWLCFSGRAQRLVSWNKEQEHRSQIPIEKRGTGYCGQNKCLEPGRCVSPCLQAQLHPGWGSVSQPSMVWVPWTLGEWGRGSPLPFPSLSPAFKGFTVTVLSLVPHCGTYDYSKLAVGFVLTSPNGHIVEQQRSVNEWIRGTAASSTNSFFF